MEWEVDIVAFLVDSAVALRDMCQHLVFELLFRMVEELDTTVDTGLAGIKQALVRGEGDFVNDMVMEVVDNFLGLSVNIVF
jgi:hypothetical protein